MIQTNVLVIHLIGLNFILEPKEIIKPKGNDISKVSTNIIKFV